MAAITNTWTGPKLREYSQQLRRYSRELLDAADEMRDRVKIVVEQSRARNERIAAAGQLERETICELLSQHQSTGFDALLARGELHTQSDKHHTRRTRQLRAGRAR